MQSIKRDELSLNADACFFVYAYQLARLNSNKCAKDVQRCFTAVIQQVRWLGSPTSFDTGTQNGFEVERQGPGGDSCFQ